MGVNHRWKSMNAAENTFMLTWFSLCLYSKFFIISDIWGLPQKMRMKQPQQILGTFISRVKILVFQVYTPLILYGGWGLAWIIILLKNCLSLHYRLFKWNKEKALSIRQITLFLALTEKRNAINLVLIWYTKSKHFVSKNCCCCCCCWGLEQILYWLITPLLH